MRSTPAPRFLSAFTVATAVSLVLFLGCTTTNPDFTGDGGRDGSSGGRDGSRGGDGPERGRDARMGGPGVDLSQPQATPDLSVQGDNCEQIKDVVVTILSENTSCTTDADCVHPHTACGLPGGCNNDQTYANTGWRTDAMQTAIMAWRDDGCGMRFCPCIGPPAPAPACNMGVCGPRTGRGAVGDGCTSDDQCDSGQCLTEMQDPTFSGGYCTVKGCRFGGNDCPTGSACTGFAAGNTPVCLVDCPAAACRSQYQCCSGPGPARMTGWCAPTKNFLCTAP